MGFGIGVGLSGKPPLYENIYLQRQKMGMDKTAAADEKKRQRDEENLGKYGKSLFVDPSKYHRTLIGEAEKVGSNALAELQKLRNGSPNEWMGQANVLANKTLAELGALQQESKQYWTEEALTPKTPAQQRYIAALKTGRSRDDLKAAAAGDPFGSVSINPTSGQTYIAHVEPGKDLPGDMRKAILDQKNFIEQQVISKNISPEFAKVYSISAIPKNRQEATLVEEEIFKNTGTRVHVASVDEIAKQFAENPDYQLQYRYDNQNALYDFETGQKKGADDNAAIAKSIYDLAYSMATPKVDVSIRNRPKQETVTTTPEARVEEYTNGGNGTVITTVVNGKEQEAVADFIVPSLPVKVQVTGGEGVYDATGAQAPAGQYTITTSQPIVTAVFKPGKSEAKNALIAGGVGLIVPKEVRDNPKYNDLWDFKLMVPATSETEGRSGKVVSNMYVDYNRVGAAIVDAKSDKNDKAKFEQDIKLAKQELAKKQAAKSNPAGGATKTTVETQKPSGKKYTSAGIKAQAQKLGISEKQLKDKILLQFPDATFE